MAPVTSVIMSAMPLSGRRLSTQILWLQVAILTGTIGLGFALSVRRVRSDLDHEYEQRAVAIAQSLGADPAISAAVDAHDFGGVVQQRAEAVRLATGASFVVVADRDGIRYSHPNADNIGKRVSTDPSQALAGNIVTAVERGTLGRSARGKVPLRAPDNRIVGEVSVGVVEARINQRLTSELPTLALYAAASLGVGAAAAALLSRRLKRQTFGLELRDIADLLQEREAMLYDIKEGIIGVDTAGRVRIVNSEARRLLALDESCEGKNIREIVPDGPLADLVTGRLEGNDHVVVQGDFVLVGNRVAVRRDGRELGAVVTLRDRTELEGVLRELDSVRSLSDALRAQAHEFKNRMHTMAGLLELGLYDEAISFVEEIAAASDTLVSTLVAQTHDPLVVALLLSKSIIASERGIELQLTDTSLIEQPLDDARDVLTVLGNLLDNAIEAIGARDQRRITLDIRGDGSSMRIEVTDSGPGVPRELCEAIFADGYTSKPHSGNVRRGVGLALVRRIVERHHGSVTVTDAPGGGAHFVATLPGTTYASPDRDVRGVPVA